MATDDDGEDPTAVDGETSPSLSNLVDKIRSRGGRGGSRVPEEGDDADGESETTAGGAPPEGDAGDAFEDDLELAAADAWSGTDPKTEAIIEVIGEAANVLLLGPLLCPGDHDVCTRLTAGVDGVPDDLLVITVTQSPDERLNILRGYLDTLPDRLVILNVGDSTRGGGTETLTVDGGAEVTIETISDPTDFMRIGITVSKYLSEWGETDRDVTLCLHSLTALLQFADDPQVVFRFLHVLGGQIRASGASAHYHLDDGAHDDQLVGMFRPLFDEVLTFSEDGALQIER